MSLCSSAMNNASCLCSGACMQIGGACSAYPNGRYNQSGKNKYSINEIELAKRIEKLEQLNEIYHNQINTRVTDIEKCNGCFMQETEMQLMLFKKLIKENQENLIKQKHNKEENIFDFKQVDHKGRDDIRHIKNVLYDFYCWILDNVPDNKDRCEAISLLETAAMKLNKSISRRKDNERS